jgi:sugar O-acyltransferase (sialic acid O-acetyltransferase NeuD family)
MENNKKRILLFGGGNQVHYTIDIIEKENKYEIVGIIDSVHEIGTERYGYNVLGRQENLSDIVKEHNIDAGIITIGDNWSRSIVYNAITKQMPSFQFVNAIHPSVIIGKNVDLGFGVVMMAGVIVNPLAKIGNFTFFATGCQIEHDCIIEDYASVSAGSVMGGYVTIGKFSAITLGVTILDRLKIGENSVIGSGSLVLKDIPDNVLAHGNPINKIRARITGEKFLK